MNEIKRVIEARSAARKLTTVDFLAVELGQDIRRVRAAVLELVRARDIKASFVGSQVAYSV